MKTILLLILALTMLSGCSAEPTETIGDSATPIAPIADSAEPTETIGDSSLDSPAADLSEINWTRKDIEKYCEDGLLCDSYTFTFNTTKQEIIDVFGENQDDMDWEYYGEYGGVWVIYRIKNDSLPETADNLIIDGFALNEGETYFGLVVGESTTDDVIELLGDPWWNSESPFSFGYGSPGELDEDDDRERIYRDMGFSLENIDIVVYCNREVLETIYIYNPVS